MAVNVPETNKKRVVIVGMGFAGLTLARKLKNSLYQVVLVDKNNYHQFQPLFYQVATAGLEPSSIAFPLRRIFQHYEDYHIRVTEVKEIQPARNRIITEQGWMFYDYLILACGTDTNFYNQSHIKQKAIPMKSVSEALFLRNSILQNYEDALSFKDKRDQNGLMNIVVVGGGPTGVELSGALAEMKKYVLPKDYPELDFRGIQTYLVESSERLLSTMSQQASTSAKGFLEKHGVKVITGTKVIDFDGEEVKLQNGETIKSTTLIWAAGVRCLRWKGLPDDVYGAANRIKVDKCNRMVGFDNIFVLGDMAFMKTKNYANGHPQVAPVALQQAELLAKNLKTNRWKEFEYKDKGSMATVGRNLAVVDLNRFRFQGVFGWLVWMIVHLLQIIGLKNKIFVFINWSWNYLTYDQSLRLLIKPRIVDCNEE